MSKTTNETEAIALIAKAYINDVKKDRQFISTLEGYGAIKRELDSFWDQAKSKKSGKEELAKLGGVAMRVLVMVLDCETEAKDES